MSDVRFVTGWTEWKNKALHIPSNTLVLTMVPSTTCCTNTENHHLSNACNKILRTSLVDCLN